MGGVPDRPRRVGGGVGGADDDDPRAAMLARAAAFLRDLPAAWEHATSERRDTLATVRFESVEITDGRVVPQPDVTPFFNLAEVEV